MAKKLTDLAVKGLKKRAKPYLVGDLGATGLAIKVMPSGRKIWVCQLRYPGRTAQTKLTLGIYDDEGGMGLAEARKRAGEYYAAVQRGDDPRQIEGRQRATKEESQKLTFDKVAEAYIKARKNRRAIKDASEIRRMLVGAWGPKPIGEITPRDVRQTIEGLAKQAPYDARNAWGHAVGIFKRAVHDELIPVSPCASLDKRLIFNGSKLGPRKRVLGDDEVFALWRATRRMGYPEGTFYRLLLMTGCRVSEVARAGWSEFHPELRKLIREAHAQKKLPPRRRKKVDWSGVPAERRLWTIPPERFKSDEVHVVPLTEMMLQLLGKLEQRGEYLFAHGSKPFWPESKVKRGLDRRMLRTLRALARVRGENPDEVTLPPWVNHDLRRVVRTNLSALGIEDHIAEMVIGHGRKGLQRVYDQHKYLPQIRAALEAWNAKLATIAQR